MPGVVAEAPTKARKPTKNEQRRAKKKQQKKEGQSEVPQSNGDAPVAADPDTSANTSNRNPQDESEQDAVAVIEVDQLEEDPLYKQFAHVFDKFQEEVDEEQELKDSEKPQVFRDDDDNIQDEDEEAETKARLSKKARKAANKLSVAELKAIVKKPEIVEWTDTSASDPKLLVNIKSARNVVPVPTHWSLKREYLSSKRGIEKANFALPKFIAETGITEMRDAVLEKQAEASLKQQQRARVQTKMGKLDIDYQKLYEAFFRRQTKPTLTRYGEVYYEGKEYETNLRHLRPGEFSDDLKEALGMPPGAPPPWLINMQKIGPPPSYPAQKIAGLNAPPPPGASWGFHAGGYGKPPLDDDNKPLWGGDIFGLGDAMGDKDESRAEVVDKSLWGELQPLDEEEEQEEEDEEDDEEEDDDESSAAGQGAGAQTPFGGAETPGGFHSTVPTGLRSQAQAGEFDLRKEAEGHETEDSRYPRTAGTVLQERSVRAEGFFGSDRAYDLGGGRNGAANIPMLGSEPRGSKRKAGDLDVSVDVDALEKDDRLSKEEVQRQYDQNRAQQGAGGWQGISVDRDDLSKMIAEENAKRQKKDQEKRARR